jgi:transcriptional regulator with XRE-family HTH domain
MEENVNDTRLILGQKIKTLRRMWKLTQEQLALEIGYQGSSAVSQIENGEIYMKQDAIYKAARFFQIPAAALMVPDPLSEEDLTALIDLLALMKSGKDSPHYKSVLALIEVAAKNLPK